MDKEIPLFMEREASSPRPQETATGLSGPQESISASVPLPYFQLLKFIY
jgi:hypothetical protein